MDTPFQEPLARTTDPSTSHEAARKVRKTQERGLRIALLALSDEVDLTDWELSEKTGKQRDSIGKRRCDLVDRGFAEKSLDSTGTVITRPTRLNSQAIAWRITPEGRAYLEEHPAPDSWHRDLQTVTPNIELMKVDELTERFGSALFPGDRNLSTGTSSQKLEYLITNLLKLILVTNQ